MRIAIDLDGTAWKNRKFFSDFLNLFQAIGYEVGILTAHYEEQLKDKDIFLWSQRGFGKPDFYIARKGTKEHEMPVGEWKAIKIKEHGIDVLFDDFDSENSKYVNDFYKNAPKSLLLFRVVNFQ